MGEITVGKVLWILFGAVPAALGVLFSLLTRKRPLEIKNEKLAKWEAFISFFFGVYIALIFGGAVIDWLKLPDRSYVSFCILFTIGLYGMGILIQIMDNLPQILSYLGQAVYARIKKFLGE